MQSDIKNNPKNIEKFIVPLSWSLILLVLEDFLLNANDFYDIIMISKKVIE